MNWCNKILVEKLRKTTPNFGFNGLGELVYRRTYSRQMQDGNYERWLDTVLRVVNGTMNLRHTKYKEPQESELATRMLEKIYNFKFLPPGRGLWAMGSQITEHKQIYAALNNCAFVSTDGITQENAYKPFTFLMDASMLGVGVGFNTEGKGRILINSPTNSQNYIIEDSREGWVDSVKFLLDAYFVQGKPKPVFDYSLIRPSGALLKTFGGKAAGPKVLEQLHLSLDELLKNRIGRYLNSRDIVDIMNMIGKCVVSGNIRRSAEIAFGQANDSEFLDLKNYEINPERASFGWTSNNSVLANVGMDYTDIVDRIIKNGEPGLAWIENMRNYGRMGDPPNYKDYRAQGGNPCLEQTLESYEICCLVEVFVNNHTDLQEFLDTLKYAFIYAKTVSLGQTHWPETNNIINRNHRIGCSLTGIVQFVHSRGLNTLKQWCDIGYKYLKVIDQEISQQYQVPESIKITSIKPSGTVSLLAGATPGIHSPFAPYYIRRVRIPQSDEHLLNTLEKSGYHLEKDLFTDNTQVVSIPIAIEKGIKCTKDISIWEQLSLAEFMQKYWADNQVSCTVSFKKEEENHIKPALEHFQYKLKGISFLPETPTIPYPQMPYEEITEEQFNTMISKIVKKETLENIPGQRIENPDKYCESCNDN